MDDIEDIQLPSFGKVVGEYTAVPTEKWLAITEELVATRKKLAEYESALIAAGKFWCVYWHEVGLFDASHIAGMVSLIDKEDSHKLEVFGLAVEPHENLIRSILPK